MWIFSAQVAPNRDFMRKPLEYNWWAMFNRQLDYSSTWFIWDRFLQVYIWIHKYIYKYIHMYCMYCICTYIYIYLNSYWSTSISWDRAVVFIMAHMANRECLTLPEICCSILWFGSITIVCGYFCRFVFCWFQHWFNSARNPGNPSAIRQCKLTQFVLFSRHME